MNEGLKALKRIKPYADSSIDGDLDIIEKELKAKELIFKRLNIHVKKVLFDDGTIWYELCYAEYASLITEEEYNMLKKCGL